MEYQPSTGWTHLPAWEITRDCPDVTREAFWERIALTGLDYYRTVYGDLTIRCDTGRLSEILFGLPNDEDLPKRLKKPKPRWLSLTTIGATLRWPPLPPTAVQKLLRSAGLLRRVKGKDKPTRAARRLFQERPAFDPDESDAEDSDQNEEPTPRKTYRVWRFEVLAILKALPPEKPSKMPKKQADDLRKLSELAGVPYDETLSAAEAGIRITELKQQINMLEHPELWTGGSKSMTEDQAKCYADLCKQTGKTFDPTLSKVQASERITELIAEAAEIRRLKDVSREQAPENTPSSELLPGVSVAPLNPDHFADVNRIEGCEQNPRNPSDDLAPEVSRERVWLSVVRSTAEES